MSNSSENAGTPAQSWVKATDLKPGDRLIDVNGDEIEVIGVEEDEGLSSVYNFSVDVDHTYFVGETGAWVHNRYGVDGSTNVSASGNGANERPSFEELLLDYNENFRPDSLDPNEVLAQYIEGLKGIASESGYGVVLDFGVGIAVGIEGGQRAGRGEWLDELGGEFKLQAMFDEFGEWPEISLVTGLHGGPINFAFEVGLDPNGTEGIHLEGPAALGLRRPFTFRVAGRGETEIGVSGMLRAGSMTAPDGSRHLGYKLNVDAGVGRFVEIQGEFEVLFIPQIIVGEVVGPQIVDNILNDRSLSSWYNPDSAADQTFRTQLIQETITLISIGGYRDEMPERAAALMGMRREFEAAQEAAARGEGPEHSGSWDFGPNNAPPADFWGGLGSHYNIQYIGDGLFKVDTSRRGSMAQVTEHRLVTQFGQTLESTRRTQRVTHGAWISSQVDNMEGSGNVPEDEYVSGHNRNYWIRGGNPRAQSINQDIEIAAEIYRQRLARMSSGERE